MNLCTHLIKRLRESALIPSTSTDPSTDASSGSPVKRNPLAPKRNLLSSPPKPVRALSQEELPVEDTVIEVPETPVKKEAETVPGNV